MRSGRSIALAWPVRRARDVAVEHVGRADELRDEARRRRVVDDLRRAHLFEPALVEHADAVAHRQRLVLVVRDEQERDAQTPLQRLQLALHLLAQLQVQRAQRLVEQQHLRLADQRARQRHPLALATRELRRPPVADAGQFHQRQQLVGAAVALGLADTCAPSAHRPRCRGCSCAGTARSPGTRCSPAAHRAGATTCPRRRSGCARWWAA